MKRTRLALALCVLSAGVGCYDYGEEVWLNPNGSGRAQLTITFPEEVLSASEKEELSAELKSPVLRQEIEKRFADQPSVRVVKAEGVREAGKIVFRFSLTFASPPNLDRIWEVKGGVKGGEIGLVKSGNSIQFHRHVPAIAKGRKAPNPEMESYERRFFMTYRYHFPFNIASANTTQIDAARSTAEWRFGFERALSDDLDMQAKLITNFPPREQR